MTGAADVALSKLLSYILRHAPDEFGLTLNPAGWLPLGELLAALEQAGRGVTREDIERLVAQDDKQRFELSSDHQLLRARQGHSVSVELEYPPEPPPGELFHGSALRFLPAILEQGLLRGARHHVHLSESPQQARSVGERYGKPVVLRVAAGAMARAGHSFLRTGNGVWLTEHVPPEFLAIAEQVVSDD